MLVLQIELKIIVRKGLDFFLIVPIYAINIFVMLIRGYIIQTCLFKGESYDYIR